MSKLIFLPQDYEAPKSGDNYMKWQDGENKFRILTQPVLGWEDWIDKKPKRYRMKEKPAKPYDEKKPLKHFWSFVVWNYGEEKIQILQVNQASIRNYIEALVKDESWGSPYFYDIKVFKKGEGMETEYLVNPVPPKPLNPLIKDEFNKKRCNLEALFDGEDPFSPDWEMYSPGMFEEPSLQQSNNKITPNLVITNEKAQELHSLLLKCKPEFREEMKIFCMKYDIAENLKGFPTSMVEKFEKNIYRHLQDHEQLLQKRA